MSRVLGGRERKSSPGLGRPSLSPKPLLDPLPGNTMNPHGKATSPGGRGGKTTLQSPGQISGTLLPSRPHGHQGARQGPGLPLAANRSGARALAPPPGSYPRRAPAPAPPAAPARRAAAPPPRPARAPGLAPPSRLRQPHSGRQERGPKEGRTDAGPHPGYKIRLRPPSAVSAAATAAAMSEGHVSTPAPPPGRGRTASFAKSNSGLACLWRPLLGNS